MKSPYGCIACHRIGDVGGKVGPELTHVGKRLQLKWIYNWIKDPHRFIADVRMPRIPMEEDDRLAISLFLDEQK